MNVSLITLLTDFGQQDVYVGVMKGAIASINPQLQVIDLTHEIPPQNIVAARFCLLNAYPYFPPNTVHVAVVDPGVGSRRRGIAVKFSGGFLVGADNGLFSGIVATSAVELTNCEYWRTSNPSQTFHGRDIFAPVAAHLASGVSLAKLGREIDPDNLVQLPLPKLEISDRIIRGCIQYIDRFGNLITNIPENLVTNKSWQVKLNQNQISCGKTYSDVPEGESVTIIGSHGWVEIAVNSGNAREQLQINGGDAIAIEIIVS